MGIRKGIGREEESREKKKQDLLTIKVNLGGEWWRLVGVYVNGDLEEKMNQLREWMEDRVEGVKMLIGGDFNARIGREGGRIRRDGEEEMGEEKRNSRDSKINKEGKKLCSSLGELGWSILNGNIGRRGGRMDIHGREGRNRDRLCDWERGDEREGGKDEGGGLGRLRSSAVNSVDSGRKM